MNMKRILLTFLIFISLSTAIGLSFNLINKIYQPIMTTVVENETDSSEIDLEKLAIERNAHSDQLITISRGTTPQKELIGEFKLTFYTPSPNETDDTPFITATGAQVKPGITVAVDPKYWELGTKFYIEGYGYVIAEDTGSKIKGPHAMDVCVETKDEAFKNGIQYRNVWVVKA
jgi:3D (Asp-Asp-Asp) domain-containing protein